MDVKLAQDLDWTVIVQTCSLILGLVGGGATVPLITKIKELLNLHGRYTQLLTLCMALVVSVLTSVVTGVVSQNTLSAESFLPLTVAVLVASQAEYARIKRLQ